MSRPRGRPRSPALFCDDPIAPGANLAPDTIPTAGPLPRILRPSTTPDPNCCWFWASTVYVRPAPKRTPQWKMIPPGIILPPRATALLQRDLYPDHYPHCRNRTRFHPWPTAPRLFLSCMNPNHFPERETISATVPSSQPSHFTELPSRDPDDFLRDASTLFDDFSVTPSLDALVHYLTHTSPPLPPDPAYTREEIISHLATADLPRHWRNILP